MITDLSNRHSRLRILYQKWILQMAEKVQYIEEHTILSELYCMVYMDENDSSLLYVKKYS